MTKFKYTGDIPWIASLRHKENDKWTVTDVNMNKDDEKDLPEETASVKWMVASDKLEPVNVDPKARAEANSK